jgi:hypothetical protein
MVAAPYGPLFAPRVYRVAQQPGGRFGGLVLGGGQNVGVEVGGDTDAGVAEFVTRRSE